MTHVSLYNDMLPLQGTKQPLFNHVTKTVHGSEPVNTIKAVLSTLSISLTNTRLKFCLHETFCASSEWSVFITFGTFLI